MEKKMRTNKSFHNSIGVVIETVQWVKRILQFYKELQDIIVIIGSDELSKENCLSIARV